MYNYSINANHTYKNTWYKDIQNYCSCSFQPWGYGHYEQRNAHMLYKSKRLLSSHAKKLMYFAPIYSHINYSISVWGPMAKGHRITKIQSIKNNSLKCVQTTDLQNFLMVCDIINLEILKFGWKLINKPLPISLQKCALSSAERLTLVKEHWYNTRNKNIPNVPVVNNSKYKSSIFCKGITHFGKIPPNLRNLETLQANQGIL